MLQQGYSSEGDDRRFWWSSVSSHGRFWGNFRATPSGRMYGDLGDIKILPYGPMR